MRAIGKFITICALAAVPVVGCSPAAYKESADRDVNKLLSDREKQTIGYQPEVVAPATMPTVPAKKAYANVPFTPRQPDVVPPLEPNRVSVPFGPLGPLELFPPGTPSPHFEPLDAEAARAPGIERLRLGPPIVAEFGHTLGVFEALAYAVQHSRDYQTRMEDLYLAALNVTLQRHAFEPSPFASTSINYLGGQAFQTVNMRSALAVTNTAGIKQQLPYGGQVEASVLVGYVDALSATTTDGETAAAAITGSIPLMRGAGVVNLEPLIQAERNLVYEVRRFEDYRRNFAVNIASQYLRLLTNQANISNRRFNYASLADLTARTDALYAAGRVNFLQVQRTLQQQLQVETSLIVAIQNYDNQLDDFKIALGMPVEDDLKVVPVELNVTGPDIDHIDATDMALKYRLDLQTSRDQIEDAQRQVQVAQNQLQADLNFNFGGTVGNIANTPANAIDGRSFAYNAGITLNYPLDRLPERNTYRASLITLERANRAFVTTRDTILADVRSDVRGIRAAQTSLEVQRRGIDLAQRRLDFSIELLVQGRSSDTRDVTDAQSSLLSAQDAYEAARADLQIQILQFLRDTDALRVDPEAGTLGLVFDRAHPQRANAALTAPNSG